MPYNHEIATKSVSISPQQSVAATALIRLGCTTQEKKITGFTIDIWKQVSFQTYDIENQFHE